MEMPLYGGARHARPCAALCQAATSYQHLSKKAWMAGTNPGHDGIFNLLGATSGGHPSDERLAAGDRHRGSRDAAGHRVGWHDVGCCKLHRLTGRCIGTCLPKFFTASSGIVEGISGVQIGPGATALTRMPLSAAFARQTAASDNQAS